MELPETYACCDVHTTFVSVSLNLTRLFTSAAAFTQLPLTFRMANEDDPFDNYSMEFNQLDRKRIAAREELIAVEVDILGLETKLNDAINRCSQILEKKNAAESQLNVSESPNLSAEA